MPPQLSVIGIEGMPEVRAGDDLAAQILEAAQRPGDAGCHRRRAGGYAEDSIQGRGTGGVH